MKALTVKPRKRGPDTKPRKRRTDGPCPPPHPGGARDKPLPAGSVAAIKGLRYRVPDGTPEPLGEVADEALQAVVDVMRGKGRRGAMAVLGAARTVREEVCGAIAQKHEVAVTQSLAERIEEARNRAKG